MAVRQWVRQSMQMSKQRNHVWMVCSKVCGFLLVMWERGSGGNSTTAVQIMSRTSRTSTESDPLVIDPQITRFGRFGEDPWSYQWRSVRGPGNFFSELCVARSNRCDHAGLWRVSTGIFDDTRSPPPHAQPPPFSADRYRRHRSCDAQLAESTQQLLLRMADYTRQTVELTRQELQVVMMNQVSSRQQPRLLSRPSPWIASSHAAARALTLYRCLTMLQAWFTGGDP